MAKVFKGDNGKWGVEEVGGGVIYEADFDKKVATRIAQLESRKEPPADWFETEEILVSEGLVTLCHEKCREPRRSSS